MTHRLSNQHNKAVGDSHSARELIVAPGRLKVYFGLKKARQKLRSYRFCETKKRKRDGPFLIRSHLRSPDQPLSSNLHPTRNRAAHFRVLQQFDD